jgi:glutamate/tyrosine decarboxylase-like PLP-dependent enzyme
MSPVSSKLEEICEQWLVQLLGLDKKTAAGLVTGSSNAIICALAAARNSILLKQGYDIAQHGLRGAPALRIIAGEQAHASVFSALAILGFGLQEIEIVPVDGQGRMRLDALPKLTGNSVLIIQAGNVAGGAFDPIDELCSLAQKAGAWVHIDGAFGLWAAASKKRRSLVAGLEKADSYSMDAHKTLNAAYDCGIVLCKHRQALVSAMRAAGSYIQYSDQRDGMLYATEMSRRSRSAVLWATLKQLGQEGVESLVDDLCNKAEYFASQLKEAGFTIVNPVSFNQFICKCGKPEKTKAVLEKIQSGGICWCGGSTWQGEPVIRVSVCSHATTTGDIDQSVAAFAEASKYEASNCSI